jgi:hypothetical protein
VTLYKYNYSLSDTFTLWREWRLNKKILNYSVGYYSGWASDGLGKKIGGTPDNACYHFSV